MSTNEPSPAVCWEKLRYVFVGNRGFVLQKMLAAGLDVVQIMVVENSYLERELTGRELPVETLRSKKQLVSVLRSTDFDISVANGCPYILPISELQAGTTKRFINVHPSLLPDLRGADPVPGALLFGRTSGATCHVMNDEIDAGDIIAQVPIKMMDGLDAGLLYQLSFLAEEEVFVRALRRKFQPVASQQTRSGDVYYTLRDADLKIDFSEDACQIVRRIKAFNNRSQGAYFRFQGNKVVVWDAELVTNPFLLDRLATFGDRQVVFNYENRLLVRRGDRFVKLKQIEGDICSIRPGDVLG